MPKPHDARRESRETVGRAIGLALAATDVTARSAAQHCGLHEGFLSQVSHGVYPITRKTARRLASALEHAQSLDGD